MARIFPTKAHLAVFLGSRAGEFSPLSLNPVAWWDGTDASAMNTAADGSGSVPGSGGNVARWEDKVGGYISQDPASLAPVYRGTYVDAEGSDKLVVAGARTAFRPLHDGSGGALYFRGSFDVDGSARLLFDGTDFATGGPGLVLFRRATNVLSAIVTDAAGNDVVTVDSAAVVASDGEFNAIVSVNSSGASLWLNGVEYTATLSGSYAAGDAGFDYSMFNRSSGVGFAFDGRCKHIVVVGAVATAADVANWGAWSG